MFIWLIATALPLLPMQSPAQAATSQPAAPAVDSDSTLAADKKRWRAACKRMNEEKPDLESRRARIRADLDGLSGHEWAGTYYYGDGTGCNVSVNIAPRAGCTYTWRGCIGLYDANHGDVVEVAHDRIKLKLAIDPRLSRYQAFDDELMRVRWGERHYLIPKCQMVEFCNDFNDGTLQPEKPGLHEGHYLLRTPDREKEVCGPPEVPEEYRKWILREPVEGSIVEVISVKTRPYKLEGMDIQATVVDVEFRLDVGRNAGVYEGLTFYANRDNKFTVREVADETCRVSGTSIREIYGEDAFPREDQPAEIGVGTKLRTRLK